MASEHGFNFNFKRKQVVKNEIKSTFSHSLNLIAQNYLLLPLFEFSANLK